MRYHSDDRFAQLVARYIHPAHLNGARGSGRARGQQVIDDHVGVSPRWTPHLDDGKFKQLDKLAGLIGHI
jgi:hypothetical protein